ncbi:HGR045Wp [Eremothecium sinecaudum]|uniref:HGR045Wp n=1 Tax=Eremothecium sinecaudum TaxID=45286 RepID=A0A0X8HVR2_9SACH|nr:HGR045Wp [Eremothecium sinecaudum]AMD22384.1 HGR045Wp [Eremothecium sinecaudum]
MDSPSKMQAPSTVKVLRSPLKESDPNHQRRLTKTGSILAPTSASTQLFPGKKRSLNLLEETERGRHKRSKQAGLPYNAGGVSSRSIEGAVLISRQQAQRRAEQSKITAKDLLDWQQNWRRIMRKDTRIYFDTAITDNKLEKRRDLLKCGFTFLGARMKVFFDMEVTIVITSRKLDKYDNLAETDVLYRAHKTGYMKIWNYEKATRFLRNLDIDLDTLESQQLLLGENSNGSMLLKTENLHHSNVLLTNSRSAETNVTTTLSNLLENEKIYGPSDRDPRTKRDDIHYFKHPHVYLYDLWQTWAPLITMEWKPSELTDPNKLPYPTVKPGTFGRCPFVGDGNCDEQSTRRITKRYKRDCLNEKYALKLRLIYQVSAEPRLVSTLPEDEQPMILSYSQKYPNSMTKYMEVMRIDDDRCKKPLPVALLTRQETTGEEGLANDDLCKHKSRIPQEIKASGVHLSIDTNGGSFSVGNGLAPIKASNVNKNLKSLNRLVVDRKFTQQTIPPPPQATNNSASGTSGTCSLKKTTSLQENGTVNHVVTAIPTTATATATATTNAAAANFPAASTATTIPSPTPVKRPLQGKLGGGYCENCRVKYDHLDQHIHTEKHQSFAENSINFEKIDSLITTLREEYNLYGSSQ